MPLQLRQRLTVEARLRPTALLARRGGGWRLDWQHLGDHRALDWSAPAAAAPRPALEDAALEDAIASALDETGARAVHYEGLAGLAPRSAARAAARCEVLTIHDFTPYCPRPHLWEAPAARFCAFSRDESRCHACLSADFAVPRGFEREWRLAMADLLARAAAIVFPSEYLRSAWRGLLPTARWRAAARRRARRERRESGGAAARRARFATSRSSGPRPRRRARACCRRSCAGRMGCASPSWAAATRPCSASCARLPDTRVRGYYRAGSLASHLRRRAVDVALLLSLVPESYGMTLDECWQAGVPVVAFDHGAVAERIRRLGGGLLVPLEEGAAGVAETLHALRDGTLPLPAVPTARRERDALGSGRARISTCTGGWTSWNRVLER